MRGEGGHGPGGTGLSAVSRRASAEPGRVPDHHAPGPHGGAGNPAGPHRRPWRGPVPVHRRYPLRGRRLHRQPHGLRPQLLAADPLRGGAGDRRRQRGACHGPLLVVHPGVYDRMVRGLGLITATAVVRWIAAGPPPPGILALFWAFGWCLPHFAFWDPENRARADLCHIWRGELTEL